MSAAIKNWLDLEFWTTTAPSIFESLDEQELAGKSVLPEKRNILRALMITPLTTVKVVILGQDPYPTKGHANGLAFSVAADVKPLPKSLANIYKELKDDLNIQRPNGDLTDWAKQGVLLLNNTLTVAEGIPGSHGDLGWGKLTAEVVRVLSEEKKNLVFILWGAHAQTKASYIDPDKHLVLMSPHPSPLSAYRGFFGSKPFSKTNAYLVQHGKSPIKW
jgi:uracil-DNA glycosylase